MEKLRGLSSQRGLAIPLGLGRDLGRPRGGAKSPVLGSAATLPTPPTPSLLLPRRRKGSCCQGDQKAHSPREERVAADLPHADSVHTADGGAARETTSPVFLSLLRAAKAQAFGTRRFVPVKSLLLGC